MTDSSRRADIAPGDTFERRISEIDPDGLKLATAVLREPNPIHYSESHATDAGLPGRVSHGPVNAAYATQAALAVAESVDDVRSLRFTFDALVFEGETVTATATVTNVSRDGDDEVVSLDLKLEKEDGTVALTGTANVRR